MEEPFSSDDTKKRALVFVKQQIQVMCLSEHVRLYCNHNQVKNGLGEEDRSHVPNVVDSAVLRGESRHTLLMEGVHLRHDHNHAQKTHALGITARREWDSKQEAQNTKELHQNEEVIH